MKRRKKIACFVLCFLLCGAALVGNAAASMSIGRVDAFDDLTGEAGYVRYHDNYYLDIEETGLLDAGDAILNNIANILFSLISTMGNLAVTAFYYAMNFDLVALFSDQINGIQAGLKTSIFDSFFVLAFAGAAWILVKKLVRRDINGLLIEGGKIVLITVLAAFVVTNSATTLSAATQITKSIGTSALMEINSQGQASISDYAASAGGMVWKGLVHDPWVTLQFNGTTPTEEEILEFLTTPTGTDERKQLVKGYIEGHKNEDETIFSKSLGVQRIGFLFVYLIPFVIKAVLFLVLALLQIAYQVVALLFVLLAPIILLLALLPMFGGIELISSWLKKIFETQLMVLILTFIIGVSLKIDSLLYTLSGSYGWFIVAVMEAAISVFLLLNYKKLLSGISKINEVARQPQSLKYRMQRSGDATAKTQQIAGAVGQRMEQVRRTVGRGAESASTWMKNRPVYEPEPDAEKPARTGEEPVPKGQTVRKPPIKQKNVGGVERPTTEEKVNSDDAPNELQNNVTRSLRPTTTPYLSTDSNVMPPTAMGVHQDAVPAAAWSAATLEAGTPPAVATIGAGVLRDPAQAPARPTTTTVASIQPIVATRGSEAPQGPAPTPARPTTVPAASRQPAAATGGPGIPPGPSPTQTRPTTAPAASRQPATATGGPGIPPGAVPTQTRPITAPAASKGPVTATKEAVAPRIAPTQGLNRPVTESMDSGSGSILRPEGIGQADSDEKPQLTSIEGSGTLQSSLKPEWKGKKAEEPFDYWQLSSDKTRFPRRWRPRGFEGPTKLEQHVSSHMESVRAKDAADYISKAQKFLTAPRGKHGDAFVSKTGDVYRYSYDTHEFAVARPDGIIRTYWNLLDSKSESGANIYWEGKRIAYGN